MLLDLSLSVAVLSTYRILWGKINSGQGENKEAYKAKNGKADGKAKISQLGSQYEAQQSKRRCERREMTATNDNKMIRSIA